MLRSHHGRLQQQQLTPPPVGMRVAHPYALSRLYAIVQAQAAVLSYVDCYWLIRPECAGPDSPDRGAKAMGSVIMFVASTFLKRNERSNGGKVSVH
jgi:hypothetical protein